ncbi:MAG: hypothetical protein CTY31_05695 [Hyphomicrobium sp.]|nr:MAG: hypothetical protein CTY39_02510 [Hyphomicrobium sp.]PPD00592.1 MAG: hypothetical protein CTY31_05695 [Hyphomicrobium sp.]
MVFEDWMMPPRQMAVKRQKAPQSFIASDALNRTQSCPIIRIVIAAMMAISMAAWLQPNLDTSIASFFYCPIEGFWLARDPLLKTLRSAGRMVPTIIIVWVLALIAIRLIRGRAWQWPTDNNLVFLTGAFAIGPGIVVNLILKEHWGRSRPEAIEAFGGSAQYTSPWWPWGECATNCSFVSGEASTAMVLIAFAFICHRAFRLPIIAAATVWTIVISANRMAMGAHFFTDVVISALLTLLIVLVLKATVIDTNQPRHIGKA